MKFFPVSKVNFSKFPQLKATSILFSFKLSRLYFWLSWLQVYFHTCNSPMRKVGAELKKNLDWIFQDYRRSFLSIRFFSLFGFVSGLPINLNVNWIVSAGFLGIFPNLFLRHSFSRQTIHPDKLKPWQLFSRYSFSRQILYFLAE